MSQKSENSLHLWQYVRSLRAFKPWSIGAFEPLCLQTSKPSSLRAFKPWSLEAVKPWTPRARSFGPQGPGRPLLAMSHEPRAELECQELIEKAIN